MEKDYITPDDFFRMAGRKPLNEDAAQKLEIEFPLVEYERLMESVHDNLSKALHCLDMAISDVFSRSKNESISAKTMISQMNDYIARTESDLDDLSEMTKHPDKFRTYDSNGKCLVDGVEPRIITWCKLLDKRTDTVNIGIFGLVDVGTWFDDDDSKTVREKYNVLLDKSLGLVHVFYSQCIILSDSYNKLVPRTKNVKGELILSTAARASATDSTDHNWLTDNEWNFVKPPNKASV